MQRIYERSLGSFGDIEVVEFSAPGDQYDYNDVGISHFVADIQRVAGAAGVQTRGAQTIIDDLKNNRARYLLAVSASDDPYDPIGRQPLATARVRVAEPSKVAFRRPKTVFIDGLEAISGKLVPNERQKTNRLFGKAMRAAALIVYTAVTDGDNSRTVVQIEGRSGANFDNNRNTPREEAYFREIGFSAPPGAPTWDTDRGILTGLAHVIEQKIAGLYISHADSP